jgi:hypothetical protein
VCGLFGKERWAKKEGAFYPLGFYLFHQRVCFSMGMFFCMESMNSMGLEHGSFQQTQKEGAAFLTGFKLRIHACNSAFLLKRILMGTILTGVTLSI